MRRPTSSAARSAAEKGSKPYERSRRSSHHPARALSDRVLKDLLSITDVWTCDSARASYRASCPSNMHLEVISTCPVGLSTASVRRSSSTLAHGRLRQPAAVSLNDKQHKSKSRPPRTSRDNLKWHIGSE